jgi:hypothetical protein
VIATPAVPVVTIMLPKGESSVTDAQGRKAVRVALEVVRAHAKGDVVLDEDPKSDWFGFHFVDVAGRRFHVDVTGRCAENVREWVTAGMGIGAREWPMAGGSAHETARNLRNAGKRISRDQLKPGAVGYSPGGQYGHLFLYAGIVDEKEVIIENCSVARGWPHVKGTQMTRVEKATGPRTEWFWP